MGVIRIQNIENYTQEIINGELILTPKKQYMTIELSIKLETGIIVHFKIE